VKGHDITACRCVFFRASRKVSYGTGGGGRDYRKARIVDPTTILEDLDAGSVGAIGSLRYFAFVARAQDSGGLNATRILLSTHVDPLRRNHLSNRHGMMQRHPRPASTNYAPGCRLGSDEECSGKSDRRGAITRNCHGGGRLLPSLTETPLS
jgi:hypothetical protein